MENVDWVLVCREEHSMYVKCTFSKVGRSKGLGRAGWEFTEDFHQATGFKNYADIAALGKKHRLPLHSLVLKPYTNAFSEWTRKSGLD